MKDRDIILAIREGRREKPIRYLYKEFPKIEKLVVKSGCRKEVAQEIFNDSLILLIEKVQDPGFQLTSKLTTYLYGINRFLVMNELKRQRKVIQLEWKDTMMLTDDDLSYDMEREERLQSMEVLLTRVSEKCRQLFQLFYFQKKSMEAIASEMGYSSTNSAKTQKYKCIERAYRLSRKTETVNS